MNILQKLQIELDKIHNQQKLNSGNILNEQDIKNIITTLKEKDIEVKPLLEIIEQLILNVDKENYILIEKTIIEILKYYNLLENNCFSTCRHKYFFSDDKKLIKKLFFTEEHKIDIKKRIKDVYSKL